MRLGRRLEWRAPMQKGHRGGARYCYKDRDSGDRLWWNLRRGIRGREISGGRGTRSALYRIRLLRPATSPRNHRSVTQTIMSANSALRVLERIRSCDELASGVLAGRIACATNEAFP